MREINMAKHKPLIVCGTLVAVHDLEVLHLDRSGQDDLRLRIEIYKSPYEDYCYANAWRVEYYDLQASFKEPATIDANLSLCQEKILVWDDHVSELIRSIRADTAAKVLEQSLRIINCQFGLDD